MTSSHAHPTTHHSSNTSSSAAPVAKSADPSKQGCHWLVPGVGYFTHRSKFTFDGTTLPAGLKANVHTVGGNAPFNRCFTTSNVYIDNGFLILRVPGGQTESPIECGEVQTTFTDILHASVRTRAIFSEVPGTCTGMFLYKNDNQETDIEYLSDPKSLSNNGVGAPIPLHYTNQASMAGKDATYSTGPGYDDITTTIHEYRLDWVPGRTSFYLDGVLQKSFTTNVPTQAGPWLWNHWTNGDEGWSVGPPAVDSLFRIRDIVMYYNRTSIEGTVGPNGMG
ncbi:hypothetical protein EPUS_09070 [Endocarpon pusillum Z07020]|uniref:GH16 domain-containing protein n=1 Tax=Endocarpon pusillum (strain Z07020 / HMAS-L-300199) TaxID=1263415 RepID=U1GB58_ENDPU|nr:uncharacterized protein EPUS_09070 [Endocarpon pusillum Z07020]ERF69253.1 hypothetical protein EPUS_09070 [Endocarpon pusillum Z07020]